MKKRCFAWLLAAALLCALLPASALAATASCSFAFITPEYLAYGLVGTPYSDTIEWESKHQGEDVPCEVTVELATLEDKDNKLPDGLTLNPDGTISGTPTEAGIFSFLVKALPKDANAHTNFPDVTKLYTIIVYGTTSVAIPFEKIVREGGNTAPGAATFRFEVEALERDDSSTATGGFQYEVTGNTVATNGAGTYSGEIILAVPENIGAIFCVREVTDGRANWSYAPEAWYVHVFEGQTGLEVLISDDLDGVEFFDKMTFTNVYTYNYYEPAPTPEPEPPQTGDSGLIVLISALTLFAAAACTVTLSAKKR